MNLHSTKNLLHSCVLQNTHKAVHRSDKADFLFLGIWDTSRTQLISFIISGRCGVSVRTTGLTLCRFLKRRPTFIQTSKKTQRLMKTLSHEEIRAIFTALEHTERAVCLTYTIIAFLTEARSVHSMGRTFEVGLYEAVNELETRFTELEKAAKKLHTHPKLTEEGKNHES